jgi:DNA-binding SARP family transcriptional activator/LysM repeat protein
VSAHRVVRGLAAIAVIVAIIGGVPLLLLRLAGSPIPAHLPGWHHLGALLSQRDDTGSVFLTLVRDLTWLAWLIFTVALVVELQAVARGRLAPRLHLGGIQGAAAKLAAIAALSFSAPTGFGVGSAGAVSVVALPVAIPGHDVVAVRPAAAPATLATSETQIDYITVQPGDCLWSLAQHYLGAGELYPEIANLNIGHVMDDGVVFTDPSLIYPGWRLAIPIPVTAPPPAEVQQSPAPHGADDGQRSAAGQHAGHNTADPRFRASHPAASLAPSVGQSLAPSASEAPAAGRHHAASAAESSRPHEERVIAEGAAAALFAGGVLACLEALRRRQRNERRPGRRIALPVDDVPQRVERDLRAADSYFDEPTAPPWLSLRTALQELAAALRASGRAVPECVGVHLVPDPPSLEILLTSPAGRPPAPFTLAPGRQEMCWQLDLTSVRPESWQGMQGRVGDVLPGLFTVGTTTSGYLLLDLELMQVAVVRGEPAITDQFITSAATEFATNQWSGWYDLLVAGPFTELEQLDRAEHCDTLDDALRLLRLRKQELSGRLGSTDGPLAPSRIRDLRLTRPDDEDWGLTLLVGRMPPSPAQLEELVALADGYGGIAVLVPSWPDRAVSAPVTIDLDTSSPDPSEATATVRLGFLGAGHEIVVRPVTLTAAEYEALGSLFATAARVDDVAAGEPPYTEFVTPPWLPRAVVDIAHQDDDDTAELAFDEVEPADVTAADGWIATDAAADHPARAAVTVDDGVAVIQGKADASSASVQDAVDGNAVAPTATAAFAPLRVGILGPVEITGTERSIAGQQAELVVALALTAPDGLSAAALGALLGTDPSQPKPVAAVRQLITRTRRALGPSASGGYYIRHDAGQYVISAEVELDWAEFTQLFQAGLDSGDRGKLAAATALVRGRPLDGSRYWWLDASVTEIITAQVVDASLRLAESQLADGDAVGAAAAARTGLLADPAAEQLSRVLMRAEHAAGSQAGVTSAWAACHEAIQAVDPAGSPQEETTELYRALSGDAASRPIRMAG